MSHVSQFQSNTKTSLGSNSVSLIRMLSICTHFSETLVEHHLVPGVITGMIITTNIFGWLNHINQSIESKLCSVNLYIITYIIIYIPIHVYLLNR